MSTPSSPRRGRKVEQAAQKSSSMRVFYAVIAVVVLIGGGLLIAFMSGQEDTASTSAGETPAATFDGESGITAEGFHFKGDPEAPVTVIEYADYQCPACANFATSSLYQQLNTDYIAAGQVQYIFHDFPLSQHNNAPTASAAAYCAGDQDAFWRMHEAIFQRQSEWAVMGTPGATGYMNTVASDIGLDTGEFEACMASDRYAEHIAGAFQASIAANIPATPTFVVNGEQVTAPDLLPAIDRALAAAE